ncbi:ficolin-1-like [Elysia marginata]|uniref:Ficolin-1-like n=1 Tax=Elysia marginata TaxID=1093978 RepID=A0AAV4G0K1_9GAST|nr:ficolin-1-like [Elysia marginata]
MEGDVDFLRSWSEYKTGFGVPPGDFWLGNDAIYNLTSKHTYELRIDLTVNDQDLYANYSSFGIEAESDNYRLRLGSHSGTLGETSVAYGLSYHDGQAFSTHDRDNDQVSYNCAMRHYGAWWYRGCHSTNLNGLWRVKDTRGVSWFTGNEQHYPTRSEMKIRRV